MLDPTIDVPVWNSNAISEAVARALGKAMHPSSPHFPQAHAAELFTKERREPIYRALGLAPRQVQQIEDMVSNAPSRKPGKGALNNLVCRVQSLKNGGPRWLESHTVERLFFYSLERDPEVVGYVTQVSCPGVTREGKRGKHVTNPTLDFLVFYSNRIVLVECKTEEKLEQLAAKKSDEWVRKNGRWSNSVHQRYAETLGIEAEVFAVGRLFASELQNAELINAGLWEADTVTEKGLRAAARTLLRNRPHTIDELSERVPGFSIRTAARMLAEMSAYGLERIISLGDADAFLLFSTEVHRDVVDAELWNDQINETAELAITDKLLLAKSEHVETARKRWNRLQKIASGELPRTRRMATLAKVVYAAIANGVSPIEACLTDHCNCGNRGRRLVEGQITALTMVVERWNRGEYPDRAEAFLDLRARCVAANVPAPHQSTLNLEIRSTDQTRRTLIVDGIRQYQKEKARTDGTSCSLPSIMFGHTLVIDSSNFDQRVAANLLTLFPSAVPRFYAGIDGATGCPMAHALLFGPARTDGLAILMREFVSRNGFLPRCIQLDRGPENTGSWIQSFAEHFGIELRWTPTGGSRYNGLAENVIGRVNHFVAHKGAGSTLPDQKGRSKDGRMKSRKTAIHNFAYVVKQFEGYYYGELAKTRDQENMSPEDKREYLLDLAGKGGRPCSLDDAFRVLTSVEIDIPRTIDVARGIRLTEGTFSGTALNVALRTGHVTELRKDCINPSVIYAKVAEKWYRAFRRDGVPLLHRPAAHRLFKLLCEPIWRSERAAHNLENRRATMERRDAEKAEAMAGKEHLAPDSKSTQSEAQVEALEKTTQQVLYPSVDWVALRVGSAA